MMAAIGVTLSCSSPTEAPDGPSGGDGDVSRQLSTISAAPSSIVANGTSTATITVSLLQSDGTAYAKSGGVVALTSTSGTIGAVTDLNNGTYTATLTSPVTVGAAVISGTLAGASLSDTAGLVFIAGQPAAIAIANASANAQTAVAGEIVPIPPSVKITDAHNNPVSGITVTFAVASGGGTVTGASAVTDASGVATVGSWRLGPTAGPNTLVATVSLPSSVESSIAAADLTVTFTATATARAASNLSIVAGNNQTAVVGSSVAIAPSVKVTDINGNPIAGVSVTFAVASGGGSVTGAVATSDANGVATVGSWTLGPSAGDNTLTAGFTSISGTPVTFVATATSAVGPAAILSVNGGDNQSAVVGTAVATPPSVKVTDINGNPVSGVAVTFAVTLGGGSITGANATTNASGVAAVGSWTLGPAAGANRLTVTSGSLTPVAINATGTAAPAAAPTIAINGGNNQTAIAGSAVPTAPSVKVTDPSNNPVSGVTVVFAVASGGGSITGATQTTNASGIATVGSWTLGATAGTNTLTATSSGANGSPLTFTVTGTAGPAAIIAINAGNSQTAPPGSAVAVPPSVKVTDTNGNPVSGVAVTFAVATGGGSITGVSQTTDAQGIATVGSWTLGSSGTNTLTATSGTLTGSPVTFTATVAVPAIVFEMLTDGINFDIWRVNLDGTGLQRLTTNPGEDHHPSSAGAKVYFSSVRDGNAEIYRMDATGAPGSEVRLTNDTAWQTYVQVSPNAQRLAFLRQANGSSPQYAYYSAADGSSEQPLAPNFSSGSFEFDIGWSQSSDKVAFSSNESFPLAIYVATPGTNPTRAHFDSIAYNKLQPTWGPDGRIAFVRSKSGAQTADLIIADPASGQRTILLSGPIADPTWLPNNIIVYTTYTLPTPPSQPVYSLHWIDPANPSVVHDIPTGAGSARFPSPIFP